MGEKKRRVVGEEPGSNGISALVSNRNDLAVQLHVEPTSCLVTVKGETVISGLVTGASVPARPRRPYRRSAHFRRETARPIARYASNPAIALAPQKFTLTASL